MQTPNILFLLCWVSVTIKETSHRSMLPYLFLSSYVQNFIIACKTQISLENPFIQNIMYAFTRLLISYRCCPYYVWLDPHGCYMKRSKKLDETQKIKKWFSFCYAKCIVSDQLLKRNGCHHQFPYSLKNVCIKWLSICTWEYFSQKWKKTF